MSHSIANTSAPTARLPTVEEINGWNRDRVKGFLQEKKDRLDLDDTEIDKIYNNKVDGNTFLELTRDDLLSIGIALKPAKEIGKLISQIRGDQPVATGFSREPTGLVHIFIDNSNVEIEGKRLISNLENVYENQLYIDYGRLLKTVLNGRKIGDDPVIVGSRPPENDSIWKELKNLGCRVTVFDRNYQDKEKEVDNELGASISDATQEHKRPGIIILVAGDGDYRPELRRALLRDWIVEIWFWEHAMSRRLESIAVPYRPDLQAIIMYLDFYYTRFIYVCGRENTRSKKFLEINGDAVGTWGNEQVMECYVSLNTLCWWYKPDSHSFYMYLDNLEQWRRAKCWVKTMYPEVLEFQKDVLPNLPN